MPIIPVVLVGSVAASPSTPTNPMHAVTRSPCPQPVLLQWGVEGPCMAPGRHARRCGVHQPHPLSQGGCSRLRAGSQHSLVTLLTLRKTIHCSNCHLIRSRNAAGTHAARQSREGCHRSAQRPGHTLHVTLVRAPDEQSDAMASASASVTNASASSRVKSSLWGVRIPVHAPKQSSNRRAALGAAACQHGCSRTRSHRTTTPAKAERHAWPSAQQSTLSASVSTPAHTRDCPTPPV